VRRASFEAFLRRSEAEALIFFRVFWLTGA